MPPSKRVRCVSEISFAMGGAQFTISSNDYFTASCILATGETLVENNEIISDSGQVAEVFNDYFQISGSMTSLGITENKLLLNPVMEQDLDFYTEINLH